MMKKLLHVFLFVMAFQMEVRVRASEASQSSPEQCFDQVVLPCSFQLKSNWHLSEGRVKLHSTAGSILTQEEAKLWTLVSGRLWVENAPSVKFKTVQAELEGSNGQYWIFIENGRTVVRNISSKLIVTLKDKKTLEVPRGFEVWIGAVNSEARVEHGMIEPIHIKTHIKDWHSLFAGDKAQFISEVQDLKDQWADLTEKSGEIYKQVIERRIASLEDQKRQQMLIKKKKEEERQRVRANFYKKVFEN